MSFEEWLIMEKTYSIKAARDVESRMKRVKSLIEKSEIDLDAIKELETKGAFNVLSVSVKSQLRRAVRLYCEYCDYE